MKRVLAVSLLLAASAAFANEEVAADGAVETKQAKTQRTAKTILHHVADDTKFAYEIPFYPYHLPELDLGHLFGFLRFEATPGACEHAVGPAFSKFPTLGLFLGGCYDFRPTKAVLMMWLGTAVLLVVLFLGRKRDAQGVPQGVVAHLVEVLALFVRDEIVTPNVGKEESPRFTPYLTTLFFFILSVNWLGLFPGMFTGTGVIAVTAGLAILTFFATQAAAIRSAGFGPYLAHLTGGVPTFLWPIMIPVEFLGLFTKPFALLVRLYANMLGGHLVVFFLLSLIFVWHPGAAAVSLPLAIAIYCLEIFVGILQAYLFTLLTSLFIGQGVAMGHHGHGHDEGHGHEAHGHH